MPARLMRFFLLGIVGLLAACEGEISASPVIVRIDPDTTYQTMSGWEVTARVWEYDKDGDRYDGSWIDYRDEILDLIVDDFGIDRLRIEIRSGAENPVDYWSAFTSGDIGYEEVKSRFYEKINDNSDPATASADGFQFSHLDYQVENILLPLREKLAARGKDLIVNLCYVDFRWTDRQGSLSHGRNPAEYGELIEQTFLHLKERWGLEPDMFELILEPDNTRDWRGREIGKALLALQPRLARLGFTPAFIAPSTAAASRADSYFDDLAHVSGAAELLSVLSYHRYDRPSQRSLDRIRRRAASFGLDAEMLEFTEGTHRDLYEDLTIANASAWQLFMIARKHSGPSPSSSVLVDGDFSGGTPVFSLSRRAGPLSVYTRHIETGAVRLGAGSSDTDVGVVAFRNPDGARVIILDARRRATVDLTSLPAGRYEVEYRLETGQAGTLPAVSVSGPQQSASIDLPGAGVFALVSPAGPAP